MGAFQFFKEIHWPSTFMIAGIRIAVASVILTTILFVFGNTTITELIPQLFASFVVFALFIGISFPALALNRAGVPFVGLLTFPAWLVCIGDPVVKILHTKRPDLVPVEEFKFLFNVPMIYVLKGTDEPDYEGQDFRQDYAPAQSYSSPRNTAPQNDFERGKQLFNNGEYKDGLELIAKVADNNPDHVDANLFMARELANADLSGFEEMIRKYAQNVLRKSPSNEEAKRILDRVSHQHGQVPSEQPKV